MKLFDTLVAALSGPSDPAGIVSPVSVYSRQTTNQLWGPTRRS